MENLHSFTSIPLDQNAVLHEQSDHVHVQCWLQETEHRRCVEKTIRALKLSQNPTLAEYLVYLERRAVELERVVQHLLNARQK